MSKVNQLKLIIQNDRRIWVVAGVLVASMIIFTLIQDRPARVVTEYREAPRPGSMTPSQDAYRDIVTAFQTDLNELKEVTKTQARTVDRLAKSHEDFKNTATGIFQNMITKMQEFNARVDTIEQAQQVSKTQQIKGITAEGIDMLSDEGPGLERWGMDEPVVPPPPKPQAPSRIAVISPGDMVRLKLLTGVNAPVDGTPYPVVFQFAGPVIGPDGSSIDIGNARLIAAATGSEADSRALFRLTDLAFRHADGRRSVVKVDGWVVGEDGIRGMRGELIDKLGRLIVATAGVSAAAALAERIDNKASNIRIERSDNIDILTDDLNVAGASALTDASNRLGQILLDRYEQLVPVVEVLSGREVFAIFSATTELYILEDEDDYEGIYAASFD
jgi:hypothetical protein